MTHAKTRCVAGCTSRRGRNTGTDFDFCVGEDLYRWGEARADKRCDAEQKLRTDRRLDGKFGAIWVDDRMDGRREWIEDGCWLVKCAGNGVRQAVRREVGVKKHKRRHPLEELQRLHPRLYVQRRPVSGIGMRRKDLSCEDALAWDARGVEMARRDIEFFEFRKGFTRVGRVSQDVSSMRHRTEVRSRSG